MTTRKAKAAKIVETERTDAGVRIAVDDPALFKTDGFRRVTESMRNHATTLARIGSGPGCRRTAEAWASAFESVLKMAGGAHE